ncbi:hypothetical protein AB6A40_002612 [Gnathostoma spinigerum]|uniref:Uncharacterized protein n=1 Tax=Gnathostoma spinigerum TaxID=75299 RepID=A0ABD6E774_9BILA
MKTSSINAYDRQQYGPHKRMDRSNVANSLKMLVQLTTTLLVVCGLTVVQSRVIRMEVKGRLMCRGKDHGKIGLGGWPKIVQLWDGINGDAIEIDGGFEEVNNRIGLFYISATEAEGVPMSLKVLSHCYDNPVEDCYKVNYYELPLDRSWNRIDLQRIELDDGFDVFERRDGTPCQPVH